MNCERWFSVNYSNLGNYSNCLADDKAIYLQIKPALETSPVCTNKTHVTTMLTLGLRTAPFTFMQLDAQYHFRRSHSWMIGDGTSESQLACRIGLMNGAGAKCRKVTEINITTNLTGE